MGTTHNREMIAFQISWKRWVLKRIAQFQDMTFSSWYIRSLKCIVVLDWYHTEISHIQIH